MNNGPQWHILCHDEVAYSAECISALASVGWAQPLLKKIADQGGCSTVKSRSFLFEARFAYELFRSGIEPKYEYATGVGDSQVDFAISVGNALWLIELVATDETKAVQAATYEEKLLDENGKPMGTIGKFLGLRSNAEDQRKTTAGEMLKLQEKLYEKVERNGHPHKFPEPKPDTRHAIIIDARAFGGGQGPCQDEIMQITYGPEQVKDQWFVQFFKDEPVIGIFDQRNKRSGAVLLQERIHMIGYVVEEEFGPGKFREQVSYRPNHLLAPLETFFESFPLKRSTPVLAG